MPTVLTLHDVQHLDLPELFGRGTRAFRRFAYDRAAERAELVVVPSEFVRERALERLELDPDSGAVRSTSASTTSGSDPGSDLRERFLLYPARPWPHKNHARLLEAFALLRREEPELRLVLTGNGHARRWPAHPASRPAWQRAAGRAGLPLPARRLSRVPEPVRGLRAAPARGDGVWHAGGGSAGRLDPGGCGDAAVLFDPEHAEAIAAGVAEALAARAGARRARDCAGPRRSRGSEPRGPRGRLPRGGCVDAVRLRSRLLGVEAGVAEQAAACRGRCPSARAGPPCA